MRVSIISWALFVALLGTCRGEVGDTIDIDNMPPQEQEGSGDMGSPAEVLTDDEDLAEISGSTHGNNIDPVFSMTTVAVDQSSTMGNNINENPQNPKVTTSQGNEIGPEIQPKYNPSDINNALGQNAAGPKKEQTIWSTIFQNPAILAGIVGGVVLILLTVVLVFLFVIYRIKKKDEGSYSLDEPHKVKDPSAYWKDTKEFYA